MKSFLIPLECIYIIFSADPDSEQCGEYQVGSGLRQELGGRHLAGGEAQLGPAAGEARQEGEEELRVHQGAHQEEAHG